MTLIPVAPWRPDVDQLNSNYASDVLNVLPAAGSYIPAPSLGILTAALASHCLGAFRARQLDGTISIFAATADKIFMMNNTDLSWTDVSGATYNATSETPWSFAQFGDYVVAVNQNDDPQVFELAIDTAFADLSGSPPRAGVVKVWGDFLCLMNLTTNPDRVQWSALNDITGWTPGTANSDYQTFPDGGVVQGSNEQTNPLIFQEKAIRIATFVPGSVEIFTFQKIHDIAGAVSVKSLSYRDAYVFFADVGGFFQITPDGTITGIGFEKVDKTIFGAMSASNISDIQSAVDPFYSRVYWAVNLSGGSVYDTLLVYDFNLQEWSKIAVDVTTIASMSTTGYTLEGLDSISSSLDALPFSLDSKVWQGGAPILGAFDSSNRLCFFNGPNLEATITTQETGDTAGGVVLVTEAVPIVDTANVYVSHGVRMRRSDAVTWLPEQVPSSNTGIVKKRARARFIRSKMRIPANTDWNHAQGIDLKSQPAGSR